MQNELERLRRAVRAPFSIVGLRNIDTICLMVLQDHGPAHPSAILLLGSMARWIADAWDGVALSVATAARVENSLRPHFERLLDVANDVDISMDVGASLDAAAEGFRNVLRQGLDCDFS